MSGSHQIFIASYQNDFDHLIPCLQSIWKFVKNFERTVVSVPGADVPLLVDRLKDYGLSPDCVKIATQPGMESDSGFFRAQCAMLEADLSCTADYIYLVGSDCLFFNVLDQWTFFNDRNQPMLWATSDERLRKHAPQALHWFEGTLKTTGIQQSYEFMHHLPIVYPRQLFNMARECIRQHGNVTQYMEHIRPNFEHFSESNVLGAVAYTQMHDAYEWVIDSACNYSPLLQFWSHGGLDWRCDRSQDFLYRSRDELIRENTYGQVVRNVINKVLHGYGA